MTPDPTELARVLALASSRFWPRIAAGCGVCWIWTGALVNGYGSIFVFGRQRAVTRLHREPDGWAHLRERIGGPAGGRVDHREPRGHGTWRAY